MVQQPSSELVVGEVIKTAEHLPALYYNCQRPDLVLAAREIRVSTINRNERGISMSSYDQLRSHGPFKISFKRSPWFSQFYECVYQNNISQIDPQFEAEAEKLCGPTWWRLVKPQMFWHEFEYWSPLPLKFDDSDVVHVVYMKNAPCVLGPRVLKRIRNELAEKSKSIWTFYQYDEVEVHDEYY